MTISQTNSSRLPDGSSRPAATSRLQDLHGSIVHVEPSRRLEALVRLLSVGGESDTGRAERFMSFSSANGVELNHLWSRVDEATGRFVHTALAVPNPGKTAMVFASRPRRQREVPAVAGLIDFTADAIAGANVQLAQALLDPTELLDREAFICGGFSELARLSYLERPLPSKQRKRSVDWPNDVSVETYRSELDEEVMAILDASYEDTLDCPGLRGLRRTQDILMGHKATGAFDPSLWMVLRVGGRPAGVLLLNPSPAQRTVELVYLGLAGFARGRGLGTLLLRRGIDLLAGRPERTLTLAVDERNAPAIALYKREGFRHVLRRVALIRRTAREGAGFAATLDGASS